MNGKSIVAGVVITSFVASGCYSHFDLSPQSVQTLNGFHEPEHRPIPDAYGNAITFDHSTELSFADQNGVRFAKLSSIQIQGASFMGTVRGTNEPFVVDLQTVRAIQAKKFNVGATVAAVAIPVGVITLVAAIAFVAIVFTSAWGTCAGC
jgi:hypothetical protein